MRKAPFTSAFLLLLFFMPPLVHAQMFSVAEEGPSRSNPFAPYLRGGVQMVDFTFTGNPSILIGGESLAFSGNVAHAEFESGGFSLGVSLGNDFLGLKGQNYFDLNLNFLNPFYLIRKPNFGAGVPVQLGTKLTAVRSDDINNEFSQTNLYAGAGAIAQLYFPEKLGITTQLIPSFGFSTASGGLIGGNVFSLKGKARVNIFNLLFGRNLSLGYDYIYDSYDIDGEEYDYDLTAHLLTIGVSL